MPPRTTRLAIFTTHPIQYQVPYFRALAAEKDLSVRVFFSYIPSEAQQGVGFGTAFRWDIPLLDGYDSVVLASCELPTSMPDFMRRPVRRIGAAIDAFGADVALILGWQEISLVQSMLVCRLRRIPIILRGESNGLRPRSAHIALLHRLYVTQADAALAIGDANAAFFRRSGLPANKVLLARYFVDNRRFADEVGSLRAERRRLRERWRIPEKATCFAFVGKFEPKKRVLNFLEALSISVQHGTNVYGLLVGAGEQMVAAQEAVKTGRLPVTLAGFLNQSEIGRAYVAADALVLPSDYGETWGLVVNEAMAAGIPAIVSNRVGCANDLVIDGVTGKVFPFGDVSALTRCMIDYARNPDVLRRAGRAARAHVMDKYSLERAVIVTREAAKRVCEAA